MPHSVRSREPRLGESEVGLPAVADRCSISNSLTDVVVGTAILNVGIVVDANVCDIVCSAIARDTTSDVTGCSDTSDETSYTVLAQELLAVVVVSGRAAVQYRK